MAFTVVAAVQLSVAAYFLTPKVEAVDGNPETVINVELTPDTSTEETKPDDAPGQKVAESTSATSEKLEADDPDPPAPDSAPPTEAKKKPDTAAPEFTAPPSPTEAKAVLPPMVKHEERPPDVKPPEEKTPEVKEDVEERKTAPSTASTGSAALLSGGKRPSAAAKRTWAGEIGTHLVHNRRYPQEARAKGWQGSARVKVTIDGDGHVVGSELVKSAGQALLDQEALALVKRADPLPKPPPGMPTPIVLTVPVNFSIR